MHYVFEWMESSGGKVILYMDGVISGVAFWDLEYGLIRDVIVVIT